MKKDTDNKKFSLDNTDGTEYPEEIVKKKSNKNNYILWIVVSFIVVSLVIFFLAR